MKNKHEKEEDVRKQKVDGEELYAIVELKKGKKKKKMELM